jgi:hypothetical protein
MGQTRPDSGETKSHEVSLLTENRCASLLKNRPALDVESLDNAATTSVRGGGSRAETPTDPGTSSPTTAQDDALSSDAVRARVKLY